MKGNVHNTSVKWSKFPTENCEEIQVTLSKELLLKILNKNLPNYVKLITLVYSVLHIY